MQQLIYTNSRGQSIEFKNAGPFILTKFDGGTTSATILTSKSPGQDGKSYHGSLLEESIKPLEGAIVGDDENDLYRKRRILCNILNPKLKGSLTYINDNNSYKIDCVVDAIPVFKNKVGSLQEFIVQFFCLKPFWTDMYESKEQVALWVGDFSFDWEIPSTGVELAHRESSRIINLVNLGDVECGLKIELTAIASVVNPSILNVNTREFIKVKRTLSAGNKLIVNTEFGNKSVEMVQENIVTNVFNYIDLQSTFIQLEPGDNLLGYDAESGIDNLEVSISYLPKYVGV